jgi:flagellar protein FliO/FliZ
MKFTIVILSALLCLQANAAAPRAEDKSDEALVAAAEQLIAETGAGDESMEKAALAAKSTSVAEANTDAKVGAKSVAELKESEIPVILTGKTTADEKGNSIWRMMASLAVIAVTAAIGIYVSKRYARKKDKGGQKARIELMHQLHLGPRKSIGLIRVAGETMLVGITEQNINMLKSVTLIDDELEHVAGKDFNGFLEDEFSIEDVRSALSPRA